VTHDGRTHDVVLSRRDGSIRKFRIYGRPMPRNGDIVTLPVDGRLFTARVGPPSGSPEVVKAVDYETRELAELTTAD
jgi:hypothetical protein